MDRNMTAHGRSLNRSRGQALVEAALVMPLLLLMLVGIMEFGRAWNIHQVVTDAARQGARKAAIWHESGAAQDSAIAMVGRSLAAGSINPATATIDVQGDGPGFDEATVTVEVPYQFFVLAPVMALTPGQSLNNGGLVTLKSSAVMRNE